jgi:hypothetical protein
MTINKCPVCQSDLIVTRLHCPNCDTRIEGRFDPTMGPFAALSKEQVNFLLYFVRCEGRFNRLEEEMKLSYPTLRNRLNEIVRALGYEPGREEPLVKLSPDDRLHILEDLDAGVIDANEAQKRLRGKKDEE